MEKNERLFMSWNRRVLHARHKLHRKQEAARARWLRGECSAAEAQRSWQIDAHRLHYQMNEQKMRWATWHAALARANLQRLIFARGARP